MLTSAPAEIEDTEVKNTEIKKAHPWRRCSTGKHFVKEHILPAKIKEVWRNA